MHAEVVIERQPEPDLERAAVHRRRGPGPGQAALRRGRAGGAAGRASLGDGPSAAPGAQPGPEDETSEPVQVEHEKLGRNDPCWCGSGKKFKLCHGR